MKILCVFGKYQYGDPSRGVGPEYGAFIPAIKNLGHEALHFESWDRRCYSDYGALNKALIETVKNELPDIVFTVQLNYEIWLETLQIIRSIKDVKTICWTTDDSWKYREVSRFIASSYNLITTTYPEVLPKYHNDGISHVFLTQWAAGSDALRAPLRAADCRHKVSFVGAAHGNRKNWILALKDKNIDVSCFGYGWPAGSVEADKIPDIIRESVICLNFSNSKGGNQIKARTFEVPGFGGFLLSEYAPDLEKFYSIGTEIDVFENIGELVEKINYYLETPQKRDAAAKAAHLRTCREHTYEIRIKDILDFVNSKTIVKKVYRPKDVTTFECLEQMHGIGRLLKIFRAILVTPCMLIWGRKRGPRAARRLLFELSWRLSGKKTFTASGLPGRIFPEQ